MVNALSLPARKSSMGSPSAEELLGNSTNDNVPWIVQKFGGTSVGKSLDSITRIVESYIPNSRVALVCSARSSHSKALGTTNLLLQASKEALQPPSTQSDGTSGSNTPFFPKRVGSAFFGSREMSGATPGSNGYSSPPGPGAREMSSSFMSSISSLRDLNVRSSSPSPFAGSSAKPSKSPTTPSTPISGSWMESKDQGGFHETVETIKRGHLEAAKASLRDGPMRDELIQEIEWDCENLRGFLQAAQIIDEISPRSQDSIIGTGERLACKIVAAALRDRGIDSELVVLDTIVDSAFTAFGEKMLQASGDQGVSQLGQDFYDQLAQRLGERIRECGTRVPVITGFFGPVPGSLLAQIGRGYTDLCAALCAVGLGASELQVWKEVDGIFTADPRKVPTARLVPLITPDEAAELTYYGSEVIHPFTMEQVIRARIPIRIKNVENPNGSGTIIYPDAAFPRGLDDTPPAMESVEIDLQEEKEKRAGRMPTAVTIKDNIIVLNIHSNRKTISHGFLARIFGTLDRAGVVVDLISTSEVHVSMAMQAFDARHRLDRLLGDLRRIGDVTVSHDMAVLSLIGRNMRNAIGSAGLMFATLAKAMINIEMISQGASEINISCVIENKDAERALNVIHDSCLSTSMV